MTREEFSKQLSELVKEYKPASDVANHIKNLDLLMVIGPSGVGKTAIINRLNLKYIISDTTREPRPDEKEGVDYFFRQDYDQIVEEMKNGRFVQVAVDSGGDLKATRDNAYPDSGIAVMAVIAGVVPSYRQLGFRKTISVFITPPSFEEWMQRLDVHNLTAEQQALRLSEAARSLEFALNDKEIHLILNDDIIEAVNQTKNVLEGNIDQEREEEALSITEQLLGNVGYNKYLSE
jgi:guanylate kinase